MSRVKENHELALEFPFKGKLLRLAKSLNNITWVESETVKNIRIVKDTERKLKHSAIGLNSKSEKQTRQSEGKGRSEAEKHSKRDEGL